MEYLTGRDMKLTDKNRLTTLGSAGRYLLAALFLAAATLKLLSPEASSALFQNFLPNAAALNLFLTIALAVCELIVGALLLFSAKVHFAALLTALFLLSSTVVGVAFLNEPIDCGCFGSLIESKTDEYFLARNFLLLFLALFVLNSTLDKKTPKLGGVS
ncbi:MAG: DoxX family membrane protein [Deferribacteres bacterium]|nr:DoxX family membrane protein [candidate division KSB1 bacterium]MCB9511429.1 DoxX family membrane protein [Deferribacteres bacterium]